MTDFVFKGLRNHGYKVIMADCPWAFKGYVSETTPHRTEEEPYQVMQLGDIMRLPVASLAMPDCVLLLWAISSHLDQALQVGKIWGFDYKAKAFEWFKTTKDGLGTKMGMGHWTRQESETILLFTRGAPKRKSKGVRSSIFAPPRGHSQKPDEQYDRIEALVAGPYCELFAKYYRPGWDGWGNEYPGPPRQQNTRALAQLTEAFGRYEKLAERL